MRAISPQNAIRFSVVAALLFGAPACGSPANNSALFGVSNAGAANGGFGSVVSVAGASSTSSSGTSASGSSAGAAPDGGSAPSGGAPSAGAQNGGASDGGAPEGGAPSGGAPGGGSLFGGAPGAGGPNGMAGSPAGGGSTLSDCSTINGGATFYSANKHCYLAVHSAASFADAKTHCSGMGAHLVTLSDQQENDFVWSLDTAEHWIGATDGKGPRDMLPGTYSWVDGEPFTYTDWSVGQPNATASTCPDGTMGGGPCYEHCAFQWSGGDTPGEWNDRLCTQTIDAICEWDGG